MKKNIVLVLVLFLLAIGLYGESYPPEGWTSSFVDAMEQAEREDKYLLLDFTGSDWCVWCHRLDGEVFSQGEFKDWAEDNAVLVFLDFPSGIELSTEQQTQNAYLQQFLGVQGYPSVWLLDSDLTPLLVTGYQDGGAEGYIDHLENDRIEIDSAVIEDFKTQLRSMANEYLDPLGL